MSRCTLDPALLHAVSLTGLSPSMAGFPKTILLQRLVNSAVRTPACTHAGLGSTGFARRYSRYRCFFLFRIDVSFSSSGYLDVSVHRVPLHSLWIGLWIHEGFSCGFPHSEICGSVDICSSPQLIAAYHVFHRLLVPGHPPCALIRLTFSSRHSVAGKRYRFS